jgi:hypothetical protein
LPLRTSSDPPRGVAFAERGRFLNAHLAAPQHDDQHAQREAMSIVGGLAHDRDDRDA